MLSLLIVIVGILAVGYIVLTLGTGEIFGLGEVSTKGHIEASTIGATEYGTETPNFKAPEVDQAVTNSDLLKVAEENNRIYTKIIAVPQLVPITAERELAGS